MSYLFGDSYGIVVVVVVIVVHLLPLRLLLPHACLVELLLARGMGNQPGLRGTLGPNGVVSRWDGVLVDCGCRRVLPLGIVKRNLGAVQKTPGGDH